MDFTFLQALADLRPDGAFRIANEARAPGDYLFATLLPNQNRADYSVETGNMTIRTTMAGLVGMDSPYPEVGTTETSEFSEKTAKIAAHSALTEKDLREMQALLMRLAVNGGDTTAFIRDTVLNFLNKVIIQSMLDTEEWLRAQALVNGAIDWTFNGKRLEVDYGVPAANFLDARTSTAAYDDSASVFWSDIRLLRRALKGDVRAFIAHPDTIDAIRYNPVNAIAVVGDGDGFSGPITFRKTTNNGADFPQDTTDTVQIIAYQNEGEVFDPANPGRTLKLPFMPTGKILAVGNNRAPGFRVGEGATPDPDAATSLGYTHIAPTTEGGGTPGRWAQLYTPENLPMQLHGRGAENLLPVLEAPSKIAVATTEMPA